MSRIKLLPYPLLGEAGYKSSTYVGKVCKLKIASNEYELGLKHVISNTEVAARIRSGELICVSVIENNSFFKNTYTWHDIDNIQLIKIPRSLIRGMFELTVSFRICAKKNITNYSNVDFEDLYVGYKFDFERGQVIGEAETVTLMLSPGYQDLIQSSSFMRFKAHKNQDEDTIEFRTYPDHVTFYLPQKLHKEYRNARENASRTLLGNLVTPALMQLIVHIRDNEDEFHDYDKYSWIGTLDERCDEHELFDKDVNVIEIVRVILEDPMIVSIGQVNKLLTQLDEYE